MIRGLVEDISRIGLRTFVTKPLEQLLVGGLGGNNSGGGGLLGQAFTSLFNGIPFGATPVSGLPWLARAHGGPVWPGQPFLVGEQGPELFIPGRDGTIAPGAGAGTVNVYMNVSTPDIGSFNHARSSLMAAAFRDAAREAKRRN